MNWFKSISVVAVLSLAAACTQSPTGRNQLILFSDGEMSSMGVQAFDEMKTKQKVDRGSSNNQYVSCIADAITAVLPDSQRGSWEVVVFDDDSANAFALPGGKIGVHTGIMKVATNADQLASVIGHEVGHVIAKHSAERMSVGSLAQAGNQLAGVALDEHPQKNIIMAALGVGTQVGVTLPWGRTQESESDHIGLELMAKAGFNPNASVDLWYNMAKEAGGQQPPEFMSTHPSHQTRIRDLQALMPKYMQVYEQARASGRRPNCRR